MGISEQHRADNRQKRLDDKKIITSRISDSCRFVGFGLLAIFYTLETGGNDFSKSLTETHPWAVFAIGLFGALAVLFDYLQYLMAHISVEQALKRQDADYPKNAIWVARYGFFFAKQIAVVIGGLVLIWIIIQI